MGFLGKKDLLQRQKLEIIKVDLGNDDYVFVREMTGRERDQFEQSLIKEKRNNKGEVTGYDRNLYDFRAKLAVNTLCDENGNAILTMADFETLSQNMGAKRIEKIVTEAQKLNKISEADKEDLIKNSEADQKEDSTSGSAEN